MKNKMSSSAIVLFSIALAACDAPLATSVDPAAYPSGLQGRPITVRTSAGGERRAMLVEPLRNVSPSELATVCFMNRKLRFVYAEFMQIPLLRGSDRSPTPANSEQLQKRVARGCVALLGLARLQLQAQRFSFSDVIPVEARIIRG